MTRTERNGPGRAAMIAPFVAWMATQSLDEATRRRHRQEVEAYLDWCHSDDGPAHGRRRRYEHGLTDDDLSASRAGLAQYAQYRAVVARTLPVDE